MRCLILLLLTIRPGAGAWAQSKQQEAIWASKYQKIVMQRDRREMQKVIDFSRVFLEELKTKKQLKHPLRAKALFMKGDAHGHFDQNDLAIEDLLEAIDLSKTLKDWDILINSYLSLALVKEKMTEWDENRSILQTAEQLIQQHGVDSLTPLLSVRIASHFRMSNQQDSFLYYVDQVIRTAEKHNRKIELGTGHMFLGMIKRKENPLEAIKHYSICATLSKELGNTMKYIGMLTNIAKAYAYNNQLDSSKVYSDSVMVIYQNKLREDSTFDSRFIYYVMNQRAELLFKMEQYDSAWYYKSEAHRREIAFNRKHSNSKIVEIEAKYKDEKKARIISEQAQKLQKANILWARLLSIIIFLFFVGMGLLVYNRRLSRKQREIQKQRELLSVNNEKLSKAVKQQAMLLGEIHHRVKNNLQVIISLIELHAEDLEDSGQDHNFQNLSNRIFSIAAVHEMMYQQNQLEAIPLDNYVKTLCSHIKSSMMFEDKIIFNFNLPAFHFNLDTLVPLGILLNELLTNSIKYAQHELSKLEITIQLSQLETNQFLLYYKDNGPGINNSSSSKSGLGSFLLKTMTRQLKGKLKSYNEDGLVYEIIFSPKNQSL